MKIRQLASAASVAGALALTGPAVAQESDSVTPKSPCPDHFVPAFDPLNVSGADKNDNDVVCVKTTGGGDIFKDDRG
ncbi:MAG: hypothetical protein ACRDNL_17755 [Spirillospora sp.]